ncbi:DMT family transporter [Tropicibacter naphthalenivorans]|uniref:Carboxylate/amino acid/amine transporter n=1 Tax=Tropicibacter naphthalenivorans TaxID=441103 RepID=A0A0P1G3P6_9RHOB|nr:DMT family transporter [Tropicibacter naphthalenivorans]CUH76416.1 carboxylate/amino acid/amine transporter [Tropicibacter naphthalenivorans]SMC66240.1 Threonine/homoserine efflux transporter RhtA [Tropicibacter naphthalenivorans]
MSQSKTTLGILFMLAFCVLAPIMDAFAKATPAEIPVTQILAARFAVQVIVLLPLALTMGLSLRMPLRDAGLHLARAAALVLATALFFTALRAMPIADAISIFFVEPFILTLMGALFLREPVGWRRLTACAVGFGGALLVIRPSFGDLGLVAMLPLGTALMFSIYMLMTRSMSQRMEPIVLQGHTALAACVLVFPPLIVMDGSGAALWDPVWPTGFARWSLLGVGIVATVSHLFLTFALRFAPAGTIAPLQYLEIVGATVIGYLAFDDFPTPLTFVGIAIIVGAGLYVFERERRLEQQQDTPPPLP